MTTDDNNKTTSGLPSIDIHIGTEKTGSTAIQRYLGNHAGALLDNKGVLVPASLGHGACVHLAAACQLGQKPDSLRRMRNLLSPEAVSNYYLKLQAALRRELAAAGPQRVLLSCENFSSRLKSTEEIARLREFLSPFSDRFRILVYLRNQQDMIISSHTTKIRNGFEGRFNYPPAGRERPDAHFDQLLDQWASVFGEEAVTVKLYESDRLLQGNVVADFCSSLAIPYFDNDDDIRPNSTPDATTLEIMRRINTHVPQLIDGKRNPLRRDLMDALTGQAQPSSSAPATAGNTEFLERFIAGNRAVAKRWFAHDPTVPDTLFRQPPQNPDAQQRVNLTQDNIIRASAKLWQHAQSEILALELEKKSLQIELLLERQQWQPALALCNQLCKDYPEKNTPKALLARATSLMREGDQPD